MILFFLLSDHRIPWRSLMVAALFALHPINVESVAWAAERKSLLSMLFFLLALCLRMVCAQARLRRYSTVAGLFVLGLMSKPQIITLPVSFHALGLLALKPDREPGRRPG